MANWIIEIVPPGSKGKAGFLPPLAGDKPGDPLQAQQNDVVTWYNRTKKTHQPWPLGPDGKPVPDGPNMKPGKPNYMSDPIPPGQASSLFFALANVGTLKYCCKDHPKELGSIIVTAMPES